MEKKGYIFLCNDETERECFERGLFGGGEKYLSRVKGLETGDSLYLYNYTSKILHGVFEATSQPAHNIVPEAWGGDDRFSWQVNVKQTSSPEPLSRDDIQNDTYLRDYIKFDRVGRPSPRLSNETILRLEELFVQSDRLKTYDNNRQLMTIDGHRVSSEAERKIDNWLFKNRIAHAYDVMIPGSAKRCDFAIPTKEETIYIEYWGLNSEDYLKNKAEKQALYQEKELKLVDIEPKDLNDLDSILSKVFL